MISKSEYEVLKILCEKKEIDEALYENEIHSLLKEKFIDYNVIGENFSQVIYHGFNITPKGYRAYEEYENFLKSEQREIHTVEVAEEANNIAKQANQLSENANNLSNEANKISKKSNKLSIGAIAVSIFAAFIAIIDILIHAYTEGLINF